MSTQERHDDHLKAMPYAEYQSALKMKKELCEAIVELTNLRITFNDVQPPGETLMKMLYRQGCTVNQFRQLLSAADSKVNSVIYYRPFAKIAILIANEKYQNLSKLATPSIDCHSLSANLKNLGFTIIMIKNTSSSLLRVILSKLFELIPPDCYCFIFYAGHGCELVHARFMLGTDCPVENITLKDCVTEHYLLQQVHKCKPDICFLIMDMCRLNLDRATHPNLFSSISYIEPFMVPKNLLIAYSTQSSQAAYEVLQIECSTTINDTYELETGDSGRIVPSGSQYVNALCTRLADKVDLSTLIDGVHGDVEKSMRSQKPIKVQCGVGKRSLYDPPTGDSQELLDKLKEFTKQYDEYCSAF
ncbi:uncharacterized protein LOC106131966 [Amyelois transitella]|uniref:uncharacterized protein LOC106131966 n=1 Tax=Amyelois transitella TaxID=680683 RepID=UPI00067DE23A|nr:uncharacterized protein LOC106131966 [Amyelois transitella]